MRLLKERPYRAKIGLALLVGVLCASVAKAQMRSDLQLFSDSFLSPSYEASQKTNYQFAGISLKTENFSEDPLQMNLRGAIAFGAPLMNYLNVQEFYYRTQLTDSDKVSVGRRLTTWSDVDQRWNLGLWQPLFQWNPLAAEQQGLSGIFWETRRELFAVTVFASPLYIPNQGPAFAIKNGTFVEGNPWFRNPPDTIKIFGESTPVDYKLDTPKASEVVFKASYGAKINFGDPEAVSLQASHMYKPSNELALTYMGKLATGGLRAEVDIKPEVFFHSVTGLDLSHKVESVRYGVSGLLDRPHNSTTLDETWTKPQFEQAVVVSPFVEWAPLVSTKMSLQGIDIQGGEVKEVGPRADPTRAPLTLRYPYKQALMTSLENKFSLAKARRLASKFTYTLSDKNKFEMIQWQLNLKWASAWNAFTELAMVRAEDTTIENQNEIAQYRNLDRFLIGAAYVF